MSKGKVENNNRSIEEERKKLDELGVNNTWSLLSDATRKKDQNK